MTMFTREEAGLILIGRWDELSAAQKLTRIRCLRGHHVADRVLPSEDTLSRAETLIAQGALPEQGDVTLDRQGAVIIGWGESPDYAVSLTLHRDGTSMVETLLPSAYDPHRRLYPPGGFHDGEAARFVVSEMSMWPLCSSEVSAVLP